MTDLTLPEIETRKPSTANVHPNGAVKVRLIQEALSRARMRRPQSDTAPEAYRSARRVAMEGRKQAARELGVGGY
ncbi:hypothetical protein SAMN06264365_101786 [Actinoplanes regularis]|uniref:Uncharacterized protein n=1 Tax=Actinoplanes regularis TaxID=52697 RepID=A0A238V7M5_9ACTN|nr:hypothetical protein Are01nite_02860 [Actinoplanes regularis]GLW29701.1 hypothetical protein Areg01_26410 [Actinoplanes regularis]SNR30037.1 hypothetical protein SAMN06264365_101786 [Actinoplanes regularis]